MGRLIVLLIPLMVWAKVICDQEGERITCAYMINRSDNAKGLTVRFHWISPNGKDDRVRIFKVPPYYGSVYDYRFLPGRVPGKWRVEVKELETNKTSETTFDINQTTEVFFED
ncbi:MULTISPECIES: hypothetical protein [unclassified Nitratiruptor]|uniref:hypothetical protein n=1 Tax=unclassified Nitratiruptor TaxID=2624044 RepID=UPI001916C740|nr:MULTISPECIES: hypothetical protein [unclassified Nitratiruptor]BCD61120.1 hypothetical protein NitYY0810_C1905 [Nitratiruptor sp. YY08-10]BCD65053.1 hypothetical protein NitYY0814_C1914 [Nitratiruptor sp. YY08-14]